MTPQDLDAAVYKALGNCICEYIFVGPHWKCRKCGTITYLDSVDTNCVVMGRGDVPAYSADPRLWAPLLEEMLVLKNDCLIHARLEPTFSLSLGDNSGAWRKLSENASLGAAVCEAFVKSAVCVDNCTSRSGDNCLTMAGQHDVEVKTKTGEPCKFPEKKEGK